MTVVEGVEDLALDVLAAHRGERCFHLRLDRIAHRLDVFHAEALGKLVIQLAGVRAIHMQHFDVEHGFLAGSSAF